MEWQGEDYHGHQALWQVDMLYTTFYDILNDLMARINLDIYVTGSNSKMLSKDIVTNFRDRGSEIPIRTTWPMLPER